MLSIFQNLFPKEAVSFVSPYKFGEKFSVTELSESRLNIAGELSEDGNIPGDLFKQIVSGETIQGEYKGRQIFNFRCSAAHVFASNYLPKSKDCSTGFSRRWIILSFNKVVPTEDRIIDLGNKISAAESPSIIAWAMKALEGLEQNHDYHLPPSHYDMVDTMRGEIDSFFSFLVSSNSNDSPRLYKEGSVLLTELYEKYSAYCYKELNTKAVGFRKFYNRLSEMSQTFKSFAISQSCVTGITLDQTKGERFQI